jgi:hypothetical protein
MRLILLVVCGIFFIADVATVIAAPPPAKASPILSPPVRAEFAFEGMMGQRLAANQREWILLAPAANPAMLQMFRDNDRTSHRNLVPWAGEFAGKYLISAVQALRISRDAQLQAFIKSFVADLIATQDTDGYLGPFPKSEAMMGKGRWDLWGQYHCMLGLYLWHKETGDAEALAACRKTADLFCRTFLDGGKRVIQAGSEEMNESSIHIFTLLYRETGTPRYLQMAQAIEKDWQTPPSGDYVRSALAGKAFYQCPKPRWESLHGIQGVAELYFITGDANYRKAFEQIWWSIVEGDRHNTGGFSSGEQATGNPYDPRPIETCGTIAWMAVTQDMLRMTGDSRAADELELSTWNAVLGAQNASGRWWTYNTPMDGQRKASAHDIVFQARPGSPELNCCSVNGPRGLGILSEWAVMSRKEGVVLNYYGPSSFTVAAPSGRKVKLLQKTDYPAASHIELTVAPEGTERFSLYLRIPSWSRMTEVKINGMTQPGTKPGTYLPLERQWNAGDKVDLVLDMSPRLWVGERESEGKVGIYQGPILLAYDPRFDVHEVEKLPPVDVAGLPRRVEAKAAGPKPLILLEFATKDGRTIKLCDFASAGTAGNPYVSWLPAPGLKPAKHSRENPMRAAWPGAGGNP